MKKITAFVLLFVMMFSLNVSAFGEDKIINEEAAAAVSVETTYDYFEDGSYLVTTLECIKEAGTNVRAADDYTITGRRSAIYYNGDDSIIWQVTVKGVFLIVPSNTNLSGYCQSAELSYTINNSTWHISNIVEREITNYACGSCTMKRKFLGITTNTVDVDLTICCDSYGNLS